MHGGNIALPIISNSSRFNCFTSPSFLSAAGVISSVTLPDSTLEALPCSVNVVTTGLLIESHGDGDGRQMQ
jgi:hypothetical protein